MKKRVFYSEAAYLIGLFVLAVGTAFMEKADFGMSMVVAPAYLLYRKLSQILPFFTFGMAEYTLQAVLILVLMLVLHRWKTSYLFSFVTAVLYGFALDGAMTLIGFFPAEGIVQRFVFYLVGMLLCAAGVSLLFHTYIPPEAYELFVKEVSAGIHMDISKFKTIYDCTSCIMGILLSFVFFGLGQFVGVKLGTIACALINGFLIGQFTKLYDRFWIFQDGMPWRKYFERA